MKVFQLRKVQKDFQFKISAADFFNDVLYIGDEKGNLYKYPIKPDDSEILSKSLKDEPKQIGTKSKIDKIVTYSETGTILVLSDEKLFSFDHNLTSAEAVRQKVHDFAVNISYGAPCTYGLAVITRKKQGFIYNHNPGLRRFEQSGLKFLVSQLPTSMLYTKTHIVLVLKKQYQILNAAQSFKIIRPLDVKGSAACKTIGRDEILFFRQNLGVFMTTDGGTKQRNPCILTTIKAITDIGLSSNYCFVLSEGLIEIFNTFDNKKFVPVQSVEIGGCRGLTNGRVFAYSRQEMIYLYQVPYETQIKNLLNACKIQQALQVLVQNVGQNQQMINQLKLDAIWPLLKNLRFQKAKDLMKQVEFDVRQLVCLFSQFMSVSKQAIRPQKTMSSLIFDFLQQQKQLNKDNMQRQSNDQKVKARYLLKQILEYKRERVLNDQQQHLKQKVNFPTSKYSLVGGKLPAATQEQILEIIDYALIKWYFESSDFKSLEDFLRNSAKIFCKSLFEQFEQQFKSSKLREHPTLMPRLLAAFGKTQEALQQWQKVSQSKDDTKVTVACEEAVKLLSRIDNKQKMMKGLKWVLNKKPQIGMTLFKMLHEGFVPSDEVIKHFESEDNEINRTCLLKYLEIVVIDQDTDEQRLHTKLISKYLQNLFKTKKKESKETKEQNAPQFVQKLTKFRQFLHNANARYASEVVLDKIKGCQWLLEDEIYLYSREKKHDQALQKLINKQMYKEAQKYCEQNQQKTLTKYFTKLIKLYEDHNAQKGRDSTLMIKKDIMSFLKKYSSNTQLDPIQVMKLLPGDWMLNQQSGGGLYDFLQSAITHTLHNKRAFNSAKYLSQMDFLNVEYDLAKTKLASVRLTLNKMCKQCSRPILDKMFVVFPNGVVCHQTCIKKEKISICPVTHQDFNKTFHG